MDQAKIGRFIAALRKEKSLTQEALGEKLGVTNKTVSRWENGNYLPDAEMLLLLSEEFGVTINELLTGQGAEDDRMFRQMAEENLAEVLKASPFSYREKLAFWKKKWRQEHIALMLFCAALCLGLMISAAILFPVLLPPAILLSFVVYLILRNKMDGYAEGKTFSLPK